MQDKKIKVAYIISDIDKALAFEWIAFNLNPKRFQLSFILLNSGNSQLERFLRSNNFATSRVTYLGKKDLFKALFKLIRILKEEKPQVIHAHLFEASLIGLLAGKLLGISNRIFTRHHGNQHHAYFPKAVFYDKLINTLATKIIAPSVSVKNILTNLENVDSEKVVVINHGFDLTYFTQPDSIIVESLKLKYNITGQSPVIGVISRYTELKGLQYIIPAFKRIVAEYPDALLILANSGGDYATQIKQYLAELDERNYVEIVFEENIAALYKLFDVFVHASIEPSSEAFGQTYVEALAAGIPSVFTLSGVAAEFIEDRKNALVVPFKDSDAIFIAIKELLKNESLRSSLIAQGKQDVSRKFALSKMINSLEELYES